MSYEKKLVLSNNSPNTGLLGLLIDFSLQCMLELEIDTLQRDVTKHANKIHSFKSVSESFM